MKTQENTVLDSQNAPSPSTVSCNQGNDITLAFQCRDNHTPLRLNGGGDKSFENQVDRLSDISNTMMGANSDVSGNSVVFAGVNDLSNSTLSVESNISSTEVMGSDLTDLGDISSSDSETENVFDILREIRVKNVNKVVIGTLNINSLAPKFDELREIIGNNLDILAIQETKLDSSFPAEQFLLDGIPNLIGKIEIETGAGYSYMLGKIYLANC